MLFDPKRTAAVLLLVLAGTCAVSARELSYLAPPGAQANEFPRPDRPVAHIESPTRSTEDRRDAVDESGQLASLLGLKPGMTVGDIGAGSGYHTVRLSRLLGPGGLVIAQDVSRNYLADLGRRVDRMNLRNVKLALGEPHDPRLPPRSLDAAILIHMYHEIAEPYAFLYNLASAMKPGAPIGIVDLNRPTSLHGTPPELLRCEMAALGYRQTGFHELRGDSGYLAIFSAPREPVRPRPARLEVCMTRS